MSLRVLILAYDFPPYVSVGGLRPYSWYKYLNNFDVYPIVITRQWENKFGNQLDYISSSSANGVTIETNTSGTLIRTPYFASTSNKMMLKYGPEKYVFIRKIFTALNEFGQYFFNVGTKIQLYKAAIDYLKNNKVDIIIASGEPYVLFRYASKLSARFGIPWIADYRDAWIQKKRVQSSPLLKFLFTKLEGKYLRNSSGLTTVSEYLAAQISQTVKNKEIAIITNGFDPEFVSGLNNPKNVLSKELEFVLMGSIYEWHPIRSFLQKIEEFIAKNQIENIRLFFYGINVYAPSLGVDFEKFIMNEFPNIYKYCIFEPKYNNDVLIKKMASHHIMLLFNDYSIKGTKIFDYIGINRKILLCYENDAGAKELKKKHFTMFNDDGAIDTLQIDLINKTNAGKVVKDEASLIPALEELYEEFKNTGFVSNNVINAEQYSRKNKAKEYSEFVKKIISQSKHIK